MAVAGQQGGGLRTILKHFSMAAHRFESFSAPARKYCCLLSAIALLLATLAEDTRKEAAVRERAEKNLEAMTPESIVIAGLTADYSAECLDFVRAFDCNNVDPARVVHLRNVFLQRMRCLFLQGFAALEPSGPDHDKTILQVAMAQVADMPVFNYNGKRHVLWSKGAATHVETNMAHMAGVVRNLIARVEAEMHDLDVLCCFEALDLPTWRQDLSQARKQDLLRRFRVLCRAVQLDPRQGEEQFGQLLPHALELYRQRLGKLATGTAGANTCASAPMFDPQDNRSIWGELLESDLMPGKEVLQQIVRVYLAVELGTPTVERQLGTLARILQQHAGPLDGITSWMLVEGAVDGPQSEVELFTFSDEGKCLQMTEFMRSCQRLWLETHGRRFRCYSKTSTRPPKPKEPRGGTDAACARARQRAATALVKRALRPSTGKERCFGGVTRGQLTADALQRKVRPTVTPKMQRFMQRTKEIAENHRRERDARRQGSQWWMPVKRRTAVSSAAGSVQPVIGPAFSVVTHQTSVGFVLGEQRGMMIRTPGWASVHAADVVVVGDLCKVEMCMDWDSAILLIYVVGLGKTLVEERAWQGTRPQQGGGALHFLPSIRRENILIVTGEALHRHHNFMTAVTRVVAGPESKWKTERVPPDVACRGQQVHSLKSLEDTRRFLLAQRRLRQGRGVGGTFRAPPVLAA